MRYWHGRPSPPWSDSLAKMPSTPTGAYFVERNGSYKEWHWWGHACLGTSPCGCPLLPCCQQPGLAVKSAAKSSPRAVATREMAAPHGLFAATPQGVAAAGCVLAAGCAWGTVRRLHRSCAVASRALCLSLSVPVDPADRSTVKHRICRLQAVPGETTRLSRSRAACCWMTRPLPLPHRV